MELKNKFDGMHYIVATDNDSHAGFMITATPINIEVTGLSVFCMHYRSLKDFLEEWEDID